VERIRTVNTLAEDGCEPRRFKHNRGLKLAIPSKTLSNQSFNFGLSTRNHINLVVQTTPGPRATTIRRKVEARTRQSTIQVAIPELSLTTEHLAHR
jgi:hypothetical protein